MATAFMESIRSYLSVVQKAIQHEGGFIPLLRKVGEVFFKEGRAGFQVRFSHLRFHHDRIMITGSGGISYDDWISREHIREDRKTAADVIDLFEFKPKVSILMPTYNPETSHINAAICSVIDQVYPNWELCIADDCSTTIDMISILQEFNDGRIRFVQRSSNGNISAASNSALEMATGEYVCSLDQDDTLSPLALFWVVELLNRRRSIRLIYSDEDKIETDGSRCEPHFKPAWNYDFFLGHNYLCHLCVYEMMLVRQAGGFRRGYEGAQDYDLALRAVESLADEEIAHIPRVLYHWRKHPGSTSVNLTAKSYALDAGRRSVEDHLMRLGVTATVSNHGIKYRVKRKLPADRPGVTILIPTRNQAELLDTCISSIGKKTTYSNYRILVVDNGSDDPETLQLLDRMKRKGVLDVLVDDRPFNFSALVNEGLRSCSSEFVCLLNNDVEVISSDWLDEMVSNGCREDVGIVGAKLLHDDDTIQHAGIVLGIGGVAGHVHRGFPADHAGYFDRLILQQELSAVTAACMLVKRAVYEKTSGFDEENFPIAFNDVDYCLTVKELGYKVIWTPHAVLYHHESRTRGPENTPEKIARFNREFEAMRLRWGSKLKDDPAYNPNLSLAYEDFALATESRTGSIKQVFEQLQCGQP